MTRDKGRETRDEGDVKRDLAYGSATKRYSGKRRQVRPEFSRGTMFRANPVETPISVAAV